MRTVLVTGFEPFNGYEYNSSAEVVARLSGRTVAGYEIAIRVLPVEYGEDLNQVLPIVVDLQPAMVLSLGLRSGLDHVDVERRAVNQRYGASRDERQPIRPDGPAEYPVTLPVGAVVERIRRARIPASASDDAGCYLCNHVLYGLLHHLSCSGRSIPCGFLHLPHCREYPPSEPHPCLPLEDLVTAVRAAIEASVENSHG